MLGADILSSTPNDIYNSILYGFRVYSLSYRQDIIHRLKAWGLQIPYRGTLNVDVDIVESLPDGSPIVSISDDIPKPGVVLAMSKLQSLYSHVSQNI